MDIPFAVVTTQEVKVRIPFVADNLATREAAYWYNLKWTRSSEYERPRKGGMTDHRGQWRTKVAVEGKSVGAPKGARRLHNWYNHVQTGASPRRERDRGVTHATCLQRLNHHFRRRRVRRRRQPRTRQQRIHIFTVRHGKL